MRNGSVVAGDTHNGTLKYLGAGTFEGSVLLCNGTFDRKRFKVANDTRATANAKRLWEAWKADVREEEQEKLRQRAKGNDDRVRQVEKKEVRNMAAKATATSAKNETTFVVMVVGGAPIFVVDDFDHAASVCDALSAGAKASGFSAKYDVVEVKKWTV